MDAELLPLSAYARFLVTLIAVLDPFLAVPVYLALTAHHGALRRRSLARVVAITVFAVLAVSALVGERLLVFIGASLPAFRVGGGLVLLLMALAMLNAEAGGVRQTRAEAREVTSGEASGAVPLAVPLLAGPGAISTTILAAQPGGAAHLAAILGCIAIACAATWAVLRLAQPIGARLGTTGLNIATRLLGLLLAALAVQTMAEGLRQLFPGLG
ncbi:MAG: NAAT family transporter [Burkholderiales bacterium]|nr:NAAT family transporter [Burkholderiales bacterium]